MDLDFGGEKKRNKKTSVFQENNQLILLEKWVLKNQQAKLLQDRDNEPGTVSQGTQKI